MTQKTTSQPTLKKLMQIIYEKQKQVDRYRKKLREKERNKLHHQQNQNQQSKNMEGCNKMGLTNQEKDYITREIGENKKILEMTAHKLCGMEARIQELQADLQEEENRNRILQDQIYEIKIESSMKDQTIKELQTVKSLLQNVKINKNGQITQKQVKIQELIIENQKIRVISDQTNQQNAELKQKLRKIQNLINKQLKIIHKNLRQYKRPGLSQIDLNSNCSNLSLNSFAKRSQKEIKTHTFIHEKLEQPLQQKIKDLLEMMKKWQQALNKRQEDWRKNFEKGLIENSIDGISGLISESIMLGQQEIGAKKSLRRIKQSNMSENSQFKRNQSQFLKQLQKECQKQIQVEEHVEKQKQIQLAEAKQTLRMTKQINQQLFDDLNKQESIIKMFKQTFKSLEDRKLLKSQVNQDLKRLKNVLGIKTF